MDPFREFFRGWFGYSRRERRGNLILLAAIVTITGIRFLFPLNEKTINEIPVELLGYIPDAPVSDSVSAGVSISQQKKISTRGRVLLNLNTCDSASLETLPGIGPVLSVRIIKYRNLLGGFAAVSQLREVYGLSEETFRMVSERVYADSLSVRKISVNTADFRSLIRHPYFKRGEVNAILKYRELEGNITGLEVMTENNLISGETALKLRAYLEF